MLVLMILNPGMVAILEKSNSGGIPPGQYTLLFPTHSPGQLRLSLELSCAHLLRYFCQISNRMSYSVIRPRTHLCYEPIQRSEECHTVHKEMIYKHGCPVVFPKSHVPLSMQRPEFGLLVEYPQLQSSPFSMRPNESLSHILFIQKVKWVKVRRQAA